MPKRSKTDHCIVHRCLEGEVEAEVRTQGLWFWSWKHMFQCADVDSQMQPSAFTIKMYARNSIRLISSQII